MKKRLKIYCEGQTEEVIVNRLLKGHLYIHGIHVERLVLEALLLADIDYLEWVFHHHKTGLQKLRADISGFASPEDINHGATSHPSARLSTAVIGYEDLKASSAYFVLARAGLDTARATCPRFDEWLSHWENWGAQA
jgi:hypothetical protein